MKYDDDDNNADIMLTGKIFIISNRLSKMLEMKYTVQQTLNKLPSPPRVSAPHPW